MGRHYQGTCKQIKIITVFICTIIMLGVLGVNEVEAKIRYREYSGYGWEEDGKTWYYYDPHGFKVKGWLREPDGKWYFLNAYGAMKTGWFEWEEDKYFFGEDGAMVTGIQIIEGRTYNFNEDGKLLGEIIPEPETIPAEPVTEPITEPTTEPVLEPTTEPVTEPTTEPVTEPTTEPVTEPTTEPVTEVMAEPVFAGPYYDKAGYGWKKVGDNWNYIKQGGIKALGWFADIDGKWYYLGQDGTMLTNGWLEWDGQKFFFANSGAMQLGWLVTNAGTYYFNPNNGNMITGINVIDGRTYDFGVDGRLKTGWQIIDGVTYFYDETGKPVTGVVLIDGIQYGFTEDGKLDNNIIPWNLVLVNYQNAIPENFTITKAKVNGYYVDARIAGALKAMIKAAKADGVTLKITSAYRTIATQTRLYDNALKKYQKQGLSYENALIQTNLYHAYPGKSEHNLGLAIDFIYGSSLNDSFAYSAAGIWLKAHAHEYGFILRYEEDTTDITKIAYEPWHYRFVGVDIAKHIHSADVCFEKYFPNYTTVPIVPDIMTEPVPEGMTETVQEKTIATTTVAVTEQQN